MKMMSETITLLGKGLYESIPDVLTLKNIPTASELELPSTMTPLGFLSFDIS